MHKIRGTQNIHDLIVNEYSRISSQETTDEFLSLKPTFKIKFQKKIKHFYKEFDEIKIQNQEITFISYHKKKEDMLNISFKMLFPQINEFNLKILTMLSVVYIKNDIDNMQVNVKSISLYKQFNNIFSSSKLSNYEENMKKKNNTNINIHIYIKVCYLHSAILNFYLKNFCLFYDNIEINKLSKSTIYSIFQNKYLKATGDQIVLALINWLKYEKNYFYDVINILEIISWNSVSLGCMLEFLMKFGKLFETCNIKNIFSNVIETKLINCIKNNQNGIKTIIKDSNQRNIETNSLIDIIIGNFVINFIDVSKKLNIFSFKKQDLISNEFKEFSDEKKKSSLVDDKKTSSINEKTRDDIIKYESEGSIERDKNTINENVSVQGNNEIFNNFLKINKNNDESDDIYDDINTLQSNEINLILSNHDSHFSTLKLNKDLDKYTNKANSVNLKTESNEMQTLLAENKTTIRKNFVKIIRENKNDVLEIQKDKEKLYGIIAEKTKIELKVKENLKNDKKTKNIKDKGNSVIKQISFPKEIKKSITRNEKNIVSHNTQSLIDTEAIRDEIYNKVYQSKMKSSSSSKLKNSEIKNNANKNMSKFKQSPSALSQEKILKFKAKSKNNSIKKKLLLGNM